MAKYEASKGGYVKFQNIGDRFEGTLVGVQRKPNKFRPGTEDAVATFKRPDGTQFSVRLSQTSLVDAWTQAQPQPGERVVLTFERTYPTNFGNPGKDISVDIPSRDGSWTAPAPTAQPNGAAQPAGYDQLVAGLTAKLGAGPAGTIVNMLAQMHPQEPAKTEKLREAARSYGVTA